MRLGGSTVFAVDGLLAAGIVPGISTSNASPSSLTAGSPGTSMGAGKVVKQPSVTRNRRGCGS